MKTYLAQNRDAMGKWVAARAAEVLRKRITENGTAAILVATGASQFEVLSALVSCTDIDWSVVSGFHLDEYVGLPPDHPASFCGYLRQRFVDHVPIRQFHYLYGDQPTEEVIRRTSSEITRTSIDVALVGIGENGHLAFNDPPADFETTSPYLIVELDEACRRQQVGEGWFPSIEDVPTHAISMSVQEILRADQIFCSVPDTQKAMAVKDTLEGVVDPLVPASILQQHSNASVIIDEASAGLLKESTLQTIERI